MMTENIVTATYNTAIFDKYMTKLKENIGIMLYIMINEWIYARYKMYSAGK